ncbi:MAG TPA: phosphate signaling complex protein PhoU [Gammaproteobacteria bacterium]|jgi:phosphate transport system protein|nr:phosphate signaling complex protein PhoU [Gammaproteobacteria bacterium]
MEKDDLSTHISHAFNEDLTRIRGLTLEMGHTVEEQVGLAVQALLTGDARLGRRVEVDDSRVNELEVTIDGECSQVLVRRQPTAMDLRYVLAVIKITSDLERIGDEAEKVARMAVHLAEMDRPRDNYAEIGELGSGAKDMVRDAITAFETYNVRLARDVLRRDDTIDKQYESINSRCMTAMTKDPRDIRRMLYLLWLARALERIGDHAKNVSEQVVYFVEGMDVRHPGHMPASP